MSYNNFDDVNPLINVYRNTTRTSTDAVVTYKFDTSMHSGTISNDDTLTLDYPCTLRGDFYGYSGGNTIINSHFNIDGVDQYQSRDHFAGMEGGNFGASEVFFANAPANVDIKAKYRISGSNKSVTTFGKFPRITGILIK